MPMMMFDPWYFIAIGPALLFTIYAQIKVKSAFARGHEIQPSSGMSGAEAAQAILHSVGLHNVRIEPVQGFLSDHYDPRHKVLRLSPEVYSGRSLAAVGVAAHEAGHAVQDQQAYAPLTLRNLIVPLAGIGSNLSWVLLFGGFFLQMMGLVYAGIILFGAVVLFQIVNLPVEFDASSRARRLLVDCGVVAVEQDKEVGRVLNAAAMTYVAAMLTAVLTLLYYLWRAGLLGGRR
jgi:Zn-dependent membrane protease YugP